MEDSLRLGFSTETLALALQGEALIVASKKSLAKRRRSPSIQGEGPSAARRSPNAARSNPSVTSSSPSATRKASLALQGRSYILSSKRLSISFSVFERIVIVYLGKMTISTKLDEKLEGANNFRAWKYRVMLILEEHDL